MIINDILRLFMIIVFYNDAQKERSKVYICNKKSYFTTRKIRQIIADQSNNWSTFV